MKTNILTQYKKERSTAGEQLTTMRLSAMIGQKIKGEILDEVDKMIFDGFLETKKDKGHTMLFLTPKGFNEMNKFC